jgi:lysophospholipase L1-like esterase
MRRAFFLALNLLIAFAAVPPALAQPAPAAGPSGATEPEIVWEVKSRFRLFRYERDFLRHVAADRGEGVLAAEQRLARETDGRGWARTMVTGLCVDGAGRLLDTCERDGERESYLAPTDHRVGATIANVAPGATCTWTFDDGVEAARQATAPCGEEVRARVRYGKPTIVTVDAAAADGTTQHARTEILVRDLLIAGLGDSIASGEGNPDRPIALSDEGFCFRRFLAGVRSEYFRPGRAGYRGNKSCETTGAGGGADRDWQTHAARWLSAACHRSLYSYQLRTALALAIAERHAAVTFLPLACTGARIEDGLFKARQAREVVCEGGSCARTVPPQIAQLTEALAAARRVDRARRLDLVLLTIGANDVQFSGLVADAILHDATERALFARSGLLSSVEDAETLLARQVPSAFAQLRAALKPLVGGDLARVVYVSYAYPGSQADGVPCPGGRDGFDIHPAFAVDEAKVRAAADFIANRFLPRLQALASCEGGAACGAADRMTFVDAHQGAFASHGFCVRAASDPDFDTACFSADGESFHKSLIEGASHPLRCERSVREFRPYASRARWIRTANDSYFIAMTYPEGAAGSVQPTDIHDATWGAMSAVYGGALHPTAEGHAAMADAALPAVRQVLGLEKEEAQ